MNENLTEEQQIETLKKLWKEYGFSLVLGIVLAIGLSFGWRFYQHYKTERAEQASLAYQHMMIAVLNGDVKTAKQQANALMQEFSSTPYAALAAFALTQADVGNNNLKDAKDKLMWAVNHASNKTFRQIARIRLARIYIVENKAKEALALLSKSLDSAFNGVASFVKGDAQVKLKNISEARQYYQQALDQLPETADIRGLVKMKLNNLPILQG